MVVSWYKMVGEEIRRPLGINNTSGEDDFLPLPPNKWPDPPILLNILHVLKDGSYGPLSQVNLLRQKRSDLCNFSTVWRNDLTSEHPAYAKTLKYSVTVSFQWSHISKIAHSKSWRIVVKLSRQDLFHQVNLAFVRPTSLWWSISHKLQRLAGRQGYQLGGHHTHIHLLGGHWGGPHPLCQSGGQALYLVIFG